ncbi:MAG TPA: FAD-dependent oxidoreductase, partial [Solirubrobacteraceae bacterium]|nr:FAD-dependent oxidoreductase [Solirubrobacteraceae bacterium]
AASLGARVTLVERERTGGECLWTGCVPSKSLLAPAHLAHRMRHAADVGLEPVDPQIDFAAVKRHVERAQAALEPHDSPERLRALGVDVVQASAAFSGPRRVRAGGGRELRGRRVLIATGSEPVLPPIPGLHDAAALTTDTIWELDELPARLAVLGAGPVGCELAQAFARLGSRVTVVEPAPRPLAREEPEAGELLARRLRADGVDLRLGWSAARAAAGELELERDGERAVVAFDRLLVAIGRRPRTDELDLPAGGVECTDGGAVRTDERLRTSAPGVFAAGDVTGAPPFTHLAAHHARVVVTNALLHTRRRVEQRAVPRVTYTDPEVAAVGLGEREARERHGDRIAVARFDYAQLDRAVTDGVAHGFAKLVGDRRGRLLGATLAAPAAGEAIAELTSALRREARIDEISQTIHAYPTLAEGPARAADDHLRAKYLNDRVRRVARPVLTILRALERPR